MQFLRFADVRISDNGINQNSELGNLPKVVPMSLLAKSTPLSKIIKLRIPHFDFSAFSIATLFC